MPLAVYSAVDLAGANIGRFLKCQKREDACGLLALNEDFGSDLVVFASKHASVSGKPCLTVHATGNWGPAQKGGEVRTLSRTSAFAMKTAFDFFKSHPLEGFEVFLEATHHGPTHLKEPSIFVEVGSTAEEWLNENASRRVAECVDFVSAEWKKTKGKVAIGFGGGHYCPAFNELEADGFCFSHIAAKYALDFVDESTVKQAVEKTAERVECAVIDWKGSKSEQRAKIMKICDSLGLPVERC